MSKAAKLAIGAYIGVGIITFGHSAANYELSCASDALDFADKEFRLLGALLGSMFWPLYWSWEVQK